MVDFEEDPSSHQPSIQYPTAVLNCDVAFSSHHVLSPHIDPLLLFNRGHVALFGRIYAPLDA